MATVTFRYDYAKFLIQCPSDMWSHWYHELTRESHEMKCKGEWLKSHKVNRLWFNKDNGMETWSIDIWGEWASIIERLPMQWIQFLKRADVRAIVWDATEDTIIDIGQHLQRHVTSHNVNVYSTKPASKRLGRDRGGKGFAIGSHKSDLRVTCYKRTGEPCAQEFQVSGAMLARCVRECLEQGKYYTGAYSIWEGLKGKLEKAGNQRLQVVLERGGVGTSWPILGAHYIAPLDPVQAAFITEIADIIADDDLETGAVVA
jgi:hypothetical protein